MSLDFDTSDDDLVISAGDQVTAELQVKFKALALGNEGVTISADTNADDYDAEGADTLSASSPNQLQGSANSDTHTLRTKGIIGEANDTTAEATSVDGDDNDYGTFSVKVDVTAFEQDVYIAKAVGTSINYVMQDENGTTISTTSTAVLSSNATTDGSYFRINDGETKTVTLTVTFSPGTVSAASARLQLTSIEFADGASAPDQVWTAVPVEDYQTQTVTIVN
jgi:hypothetical protein